jgi:hypothetical protein
MNTTVQTNDATLATRDVAIEATHNAEIRIAALNAVASAKIAVKNALASAVIAAKNATVDVKNAVHIATRKIAAMTSPATMEETVRDVADDLEIEARNATSMVKVAASDVKIAIRHRDEMMAVVATDYPALVAIAIRHNSFLARNRDYFYPELVLDVQDAERDASVEGHVSSRVAKLRSCLANLATSHVDKKGSETLESEACCKSLLEVLKPSIVAGLQVCWRALATEMVGVLSRKEANSHELTEIRASTVMAVWDALISIMALASQE